MTNKYWDDIQKHPAWLKRCEMWNKQEQGNKLLEEADKMYDEVQGMCDHKYTNGCHADGSADCVICGKDYVPKGIDINDKKYNEYGLEIKK